MRRTEKQMKQEEKRSFGASHAYNCNYPREPCNCEVNNKSERRTSHSYTCTYPSDPCSCGL
jgi:hypothetical protein